MVPEGYLQGGVGRTTPDQLTDILVHQIVVSFLPFFFDLFLACVLTFLSKFLLFLLVSQHAVKLAALYQEYQDHHSGYPQELTQMRARLRSLDFKVARLRPYDAKVGRLRGLLVELAKGQQAKTSAKAKAVDYDHLMSQLAKKTEECTLLRAQQAKIDAKLFEKIEECIHLRTQKAETEAKLADTDIYCSKLQARLSTTETQL